MNGVERERCTNGEIYGRHYRVVSALASGGMSFVYIAEDLRTRDAIALKVLRDPYRERTSVRKRLLLEGEFLCACPSPFVPRGHAYGIDPACGPYVAMELLTGRPLADMTRMSPPTPAQVARLGEQLARALDPFHRAGVIHRDLKPDNVFFSNADVDYDLKILDWGIAKMDGYFISPETGDEMPLGTTKYMSPERVRGERLTPASDIYSMGVMLYELIARRHCYAASRPDDMDYARRHVGGQLLPLDEAPREVALEIERALARRPEERHASMTAFADALRRAHEAVVSTDETRFVESRRLLGLAHELAAPATERKPPSLLSPQPAAALPYATKPRRHAPRPVLAQLVVAAGAPPGTRFDLCLGRHTIGRGGGASLRVDEPTVSSLGAAIEVLPDGGFILENLGNSNGILVNGLWLEPRDPLPLLDGDRIAIGRLIMFFCAAFPRT